MMTKPVVLGVMLFIAGLIVGRASVLMTQPSTPTPVPAAAALPPNHPPMNAPQAAPSAPSEGGGKVLSGTIAEVIQVPQYTYLRLQTGEWAAVPSAPQLAAGQPVEVSLQTEMVNFTSPSLGRSFERIWFGALPGGGGSQHQEPPVAIAPRGSAPEVKDALRAVDQGGPALTLRVTDIYATKDMLGGKRVKVKGTVDRVMAVQGLTYVHLKDGTGAAADKTDDLLCLTAGELQKGATVTLEGVIALNKDVGMGPLPVVLDQATAK